MIGKTNEKKYDLSIFNEILKKELRHIRENWLVFAVCFFIARQNIIDEIFPFAIVILCSYCYAMGPSAAMLAAVVAAVLTVQLNFVYVIMLIAVYAYFLNFREEKKSILVVAGYAAVVLLISKLTILLADGFNINGFMLIIFETIFVFSATVLANEGIKRIRLIKSGVKKGSVHRAKREKQKTMSEEAAIAGQSFIKQPEERQIKNIDDYRKAKYLNIFTDKAKLKIKEQLLWQNMQIKFFEVLSPDKDSTVLSVTVKTERTCDEAKRAVELIVRNVCGVRLKCTDWVIPSQNYYVLKFKSIKRVKIRTYSATAVKDGSEVSGDSFAHAGRADRYYTVLCDGTGSGEEAYNESTGAVDLLSKFLYTDFSEEQILRTLNTILMIKLGDERFVTVDFSIIDYSSREMRLYKAGAAPTYIISGKAVDKISGRSLPMGIVDNFEYSSFKKKIEIGDIVIMVSDGITDSITFDEKKSLDRYLETLTGKEPQAIANSILSYALRGQDKVMDDMTVLVTKIG